MIAMLIVMNAPEVSFEVLRLLLTRVSLLTSFDASHLEDVQQVKREGAVYSKDIQNLGFVTNFGYESYPVPHGKPPKYHPVTEEYDLVPTKLKDLGLLLHVNNTSESAKRRKKRTRKSSIRLPKVKRSRTIPAEATCPSISTSYTDTDIRTHFDLPTEDINLSLEATKTLKRRKNDGNKKQNYANLKVCPNWKKRMDLTPAGKKTHVEVCGRNRTRSGRKERQKEGEGGRKKRRIAVELSI